MPTLALALTMPEDPHTPASSARAQSPAAPQSDAPLTMPASPERAARDIAAIGVEGRPADASSGPGMLRLEMLAMLAVIAVVALGVGFFSRSWVLGGALLVIGSLALFLNPVIGATAHRERDRREAADQERGRPTPPRSH